MTVQTDFTTYQPPGVYFDEVATSLAPTVGVPPVVLALVGPAVGYRTTTEQVSLAIAGVVLKNLGAIPASISVVRLDTGATVASSDYVVSNPTGSPLVDQNYTTEIARAPDATTPEGTIVAVTYNYQEPTYFDPKTFDNFEDVKDAYGEPLNFTPPAPGDTTYKAVLSPLSLAAQIAFQNGARSLVLVPVTAPTGSASAQSSALLSSLTAAYAKIAADPTVNIVVPVTAGILPADAPTAATNLKTHVDATSADGFPRIGIIGFDPPASGAGIDAAAIATSVRDKRMMLAYASGLGLTYYVSQTGQSIVLGAGYLAAAYGGTYARLPIQKALTKETVQGFTGIVGQPLSNRTKNTLSDAGVAVTEANRYGNLVVRHGTSTDRTNVNTREVSLVRERDAMVSVLAVGLDDPTLIGQPITTETLLNIKGAVANLLEICVGSGVILGYTSLGVRLRSTDPSVVEVKFAYQPAYPLNYIDVSFSIDTSTGVVDITALAA